VRVLALPRYAPSGASSRYRFFQYLPALAAQGLEVEAAPLLDAAYLDERYRTGRRAPGLILAAYARRLRALAGARSFDLVWLEKEALPFIPAPLERLVRARRVPYVVDYDDAEFHRYDAHGSPLVRLVLGAKIDAVMRGAALVIAGNDYIAARARRAGAPRVAVLPTVVDLERYAVSPPRAGGVFTIGWIGTPLTAPFLAAIAAPLRAVCAGGRARVLAIGAGRLDLPGVPVEVRPWSAATEARDLADVDVGVMPLPDSPFERGKCGLKLIQYLACGRPVVGSSVGVNTQIIQPGVNGYRADRPAEWVAALTALRADPARRAAMGRAGRRLVEERYALAVTAPRLGALLREAARLPAVTPCAA
jgi:glycosyltransferase involved in cell wall biosynthesis